MNSKLYLSKCEKCNEFPSIAIIFDSKIKLRFESKCKLNKIVILEDYLSSLNSSTVNDIKCKFHKKAFVFYCKKCNMNI